MTFTFISEQTLIRSQKRKLDLLAKANVRAWVPTEKMRNMMSKWKIITIDSPRNPLTQWKADR